MEDLLNLYVYPLLAIVSTISLFMIAVMLEKISDKLEK
jgi:hypothetical protein